MIRLKFNSILFLFLLLFIYFSQNVEGGKDKVPEQTEEAAKEIKTNRNVWGKKQTILGKNEVKGEEKDEKEYENNFPLFNGKKLHKKEIREYSYLNQNKNKEKCPEFLKREEESKNQDKNQGKEENVEILNFQKDSVQSSPKSSGEDTVAAQEKEKIEKVESSTSNQSDRDLPPEEKCSESSQCLKTEEDENEEKEEDELNIKNLFSPNNSVHSSPKSSEEQSVVIDPTEESNENLSDGDLENKFCNETIEFLKNEKEKEEKGKGKLKMGESVKSFIQNGQIQGNLKQTRGFSRNLRRKKVRFYRNQANSDGESSSTFQQQLTQKSPNAFVGYNNFRRNLNQPKPLFKPYQTNYQQNSSVLGKPQAHLNNLHMSPRISSPSSPSTPMHYQVHTVQQQVQEPRQVTIINHHYYIPTPIYQVHEQTPHIPVQPVYYPMIPVHHFDNNNQFYTQNYSMPAPIVPLAYNHNADLSQLLPVDRLSFTQDETSQPRSHPQNSGRYNRNNIQSKNQHP